MLLWGVASAQAATTATTSFTVPGSYEFTVPAGVSSLTLDVTGAPGGGAGAFSGGEGATVAATVSVSPGEQLFVGVGGAGQRGLSGFATAPGGIGGGGTGGSGAFGGGGGGGDSLVGLASPSSSFESLFVVAGGGGGGSVGNFGGNADASGLPSSSCPSSGSACGGGAGSATAGGAGGATAGGNPGSAGSSGEGGAGGAAAGVVPQAFGGGGGGGGLFGGGGGGESDNGGVGGSGGGGASFVTPGATGVSGPTPTSAAAGVTITYPVPTADESTGSLAFVAQPQGTASAEELLTVTNNGSAPLIVSGVLVGGANPADYLTDDRCQQPVAAGATCQVGVRFDPQGAGPSAATLTLLTNAVSAPAPVSLSGTGGALPQGAVGATGAGGPAGPPGPAGKVELVTCKPVTKTVKRRGHVHKTTHQQCTAKLVSGTVTFNATGAGVVHATLDRGRVVYASGVVAGGGAAGQTLILSPLRAMPAGRYTLTLRTVLRGRWVTRRIVIVLR
jgi:hypothetical protein